MSNNYSLKAFQESLTQRIKDAATGPAPNSRLGVQSGSLQWLLRLDEVDEVIPMADVTAHMAPVPLTRSWYLGLANVRGNLVSVVDFSLFAQGEPTAMSASARIVLIAARFHCHCALLFDRMIGLRNLDRLQARPEQTGATDPARVWQGTGSVGSDGQIWRELEIGKLVEDERFLWVGSQEAGST